MHLPDKDLLILNSSSDTTILILTIKNSPVFSYIVRRGEIGNIDSFKDIKDFSDTLVINRFLNTVFGKQSFK